MTRMLLAAALATALATALGATLPAGAAQAKDTLTVGMVLEPPHLDPTAGAASAIREVTYANIYEGLTRIDAPGEVQAGARGKLDDLAGRPDLHIPAAHGGVKFHDGTPFDCSIVQVLATSAPSPPTASTRRSSLFEPIARTTAPTR